MLARIFVISSALLFFAGCSKEKDIKEDSKAKVEYTEVMEKDQYGNCEDRTQGCASIMISYPEFTGSAAADTLNSLLNRFNYNGIFVEETFPDFAELAKHFLNDYQNFKREFPDSPQQWYMKRITKVRFMDNSLCSISMRQDEYTGGAHPNSIRNFVNFDWRSAGIIKLSDLFEEGYQQELNRIAERKFRKIRNLSDDADLETEGFWFENNRFSVNENFAISPDSILFYFNSYEVAPYSKGDTEFSIGLNELKGIVKSDGLLSGYVN